MAIDDIRNDPTLQLLKTMAAADVDRARAERIHGRCRHAWRRRQRARRLTGIPMASASGRVLEFAVAGALCAVYLAEVLRRALSLLG